MFREERWWRQRLSLAFDLEFFRINHFSRLPDFDTILARWKTGRRSRQHEFAFELGGVGLGRRDEALREHEILKSLDPTLADALAKSLKG